MSLKHVEKPEDLSQEDLARFIIDMFHRIIVHYTMWYMETEHQLGIPKSLNILKEARKNSYSIQMDRLAKDGLRFTQFYNTARCWPTRNVLLSGLSTAVNAQVNSSQLPMKVNIVTVANAGEESGKINLKKISK